MMLNSKEFSIEKEGGVWYYGHKYTYGCQPTPSTSVLVVLAFWYSLYYYIVCTHSTHLGSIVSLPPVS